MLAATGSMPADALHVRINVSYVIQTIKELCIGWLLIELAFQVVLYTT